MNIAHKIVYLTLSGMLFISTNARAEALQATAYLNLLFDKDVEKAETLQIQSRQNFFSTQDKTKISDIVLSCRQQTFGAQKTQNNIKDLKQQYSVIGNSSDENQKWHDLAESKIDEMDNTKSRKMLFEYFQAQEALNNSSPSLIVNENNNEDDQSFETNAY